MSLFSSSCLKTAKQTLGQWMSSGTSAGNEHVCRRTDVYAASILWNADITHHRQKYLLERKHTIQSTGLHLTDAMADTWKI